MNDEPDSSPPPPPPPEPESPPVAPSGPTAATAAGPPSAAGPPKRGRGRLIAIIAAAVVLVLIGVGVGVGLSGGGASSPAAGRSPSPTGSPFVHAPTNLTAKVKGLTVTLSWTPPPEAGKQVFTYSIYRGGSQVGSVSVPETSWTDDTARPGTHEYAVVANTPGPLKSARVTIDVTIKTPPLSAARLSGPFNVKTTVVSQSGYTSTPGGTLGWSFKPKCKAGACSVTWSIIGFKEIRTTLNRHGVRYTGSDSGKFHTKCGSVTTSSTVTVDIKVTKARAISGVWRATALTGTMTEYEPSQLGCVTSRATFKITGSFVG